LEETFKEAFFVNDVLLQEKISNKVAAIRNFFFIDGVLCSK